MTNYEYSEQLKAFSENATLDLTKEYFEKYWLRLEQYRQIISVKDSLFHDNVSFPQMLFRDQFEILALPGGLVFAREDFECLKLCMLALGEKYFFVIEDDNFKVSNKLMDSDYEDKPYPALRFRYPVDITWEQLVNGGLVTIELYGMPHKNYFVFGESGNWGKYVSNESIEMFDIIGFKKEYSELLKRSFKPLMKEILQTSNCLPTEYRVRLSSSRIDRIWNRIVNYCRASGRH